MEREDILKRVQKGNNDEFERRVSSRATLWGCFIGLIVGTVVFLLDYYVNGKMNVGLIIVAMTSNAVQWLIEGIRCRKTIVTICGVVFALLAVVSIITFCGMLGVKA